MNAVGLEAGLAFVARRLLFSAVGITELQRDRLRDIERGRFPMKTLQELIAIARCSVKPEDREALAEIIRAELLADLPAVTDPTIAGALELEAQGPHDVAYRAFELMPTRVTAERAIETGTRHLYGLRAQLDVAHAFHRC